MKIAETWNRTVLPIFIFCVQEKQFSQSSYFTSTLQTERQLNLIDILLGTAVIPGKKAAQNMQMLVYAELRYVGGSTEAKHSIV